MDGDGLRCNVALLVVGTGIGLQHEIITRNHARNPYNNPDPNYNKHTQEPMAENTPLK